MKKEIMRIDADTVSANPLVFREMIENLNFEGAIVLYNDTDADGFYLEWTVDGTEYHATSSFEPLG